MNILNKAAGLGRYISRSAKKNSPAILLVTGIVGAVASAVVACKATTKAPKIAEESKNELDKLNAEMESVKASDISDEELEARLHGIKKEVTKTWFRAIKKYAMLYLPAGAIMVASVLCLIASHGKMKQRIGYFASVAAAAEQRFEDYSRRVEERFGHEIEQEIRYGAHEEEYEETVTDKRGKEKTVKKKRTVFDPSTIGEHDRFFDASCNDWNKNPEANKKFILCQEAYINKILERRAMFDPKGQGSMCMNEIFHLFGYPSTTQGAIDQFIYSATDEKYNKRFTFGLESGESAATRRFVNGDENVILLQIRPNANAYDI